MDLLAVGLGNQHRGGLVVKSMLREVDFRDDERCLRSNWNFLWAETLREIRASSGVAVVWGCGWKSRADKISPPARIIVAQIFSSQLSATLAPNRSLFCWPLSLFLALRLLSQRVVHDGLAKSQRSHYQL